MSDAFCPLPFTHMIINNDGTVSPCCVSDERYRDGNGRAFIMDRDGMLDAWNGTHIADLRRDLASGIRNKACNNCWSMEEKGLDSHRLKMVRSMSHPGFAVSGIDPVVPMATATPRFLSIRYGNLCNLKCRICGPAASSRWIEEHNQEHGNDWLANQVQHLADDGNIVKRHGVMNWFEDNDRFWDEFRSLLPDMNEMMFTGGEPFLIRRQLDMLRECSRSGHADHIDVQFHTNGTVLDDDILTDVLPRFRSVSMWFSTDGTGRQFEYQRHGGDWSVVDAAMRRCLDLWNQPRGPKGLVMVNLTVSAMNVWYLPEYADYFNEIGMVCGLSMLNHRQELNHSNLTNVVKATIAKKLRETPRHRVRCYQHGTSWDGIIASLETTDDRAGLQPFIAATRRMDLYRGESFADVFPEMADLVGYRGP